MRLRPTARAADRRAFLRTCFGLGGFALTASMLSACGPQAPAPAAAPAPSKPASAPAAAPAATAAPAAPKPAAPKPAAAGTNAPAKPAAAAPATTAPAASTRKGGKLVIRIGDVQTPDPHRETGSFHWPQATAEGLTGIAGDGSLKPRLAEKWEITDGRVYTFQLRKGVKFHNGREMTAEDVKANFERINGLDRAWLKATTATVEKYEVVDAHTVRITLKQPYAPFLALISEGWILAPESPGWDANITAPIGTGAFVWQEFVPKTQLTLKRHEQFWRAPAPSFDEVIGRFSEGDPVVALKTGDVHIASINRDQSSALEKESAVRVITNKASTWWFLSFNNRKPRPPFDDVRVRRAIAHTLDKPRLAELQGGKTGVIANQMALPGSFYYDAGLADAYAKPDVEAGKKLLAEAGVDPKSVKIVMPVNTDPRVPQAVAAMIEQLGFEIDLQVGDDLATETRLQKYDWDAYYASSGPRTDIALRYVRMMSDGPNPGLWGGVQDPEYDKYVKEAWATIDDQGRRAAYLKAWGRVMDGLYTVVTAHSLSSYGVRNEVQNFELGAVPGVDLVDSGISYASFS
ncbi:MAG: ABC transporter substrate-binding protein [Chloroflexota bacterium]